MKPFRVQKITSRGSKNYFFNNLTEAYKKFKEIKGTAVYLDNLELNRTIKSK